MKIIQIVLIICLCIVLGFFLSKYLFPFFSKFSSGNISDSISKNNPANIEAFIGTGFVSTPQISTLLSKLMETEDFSIKLELLHELSGIILSEDFLTRLYNSKNPEKEIRFWRYLVLTENDMIRVNKFMDKLGKKKTEGIQTVTFLKLESEYNKIDFKMSDYLRNKGSSQELTENRIKLNIPGKIIIADNLDNPGTKTPSKVLFEGSFEQYVNFIIGSTYYILIGDIHKKMDVGTGAIVLDNSYLINK